MAAGDEKVGVLEFSVYFRMFRKWLWLLALVGIVAAASGLAVGLRKQPLYQASSTLLVNQSDAIVPGAQFLTDPSARRETYAQLVTSRPVLAAAIQRLHLPTTPEKLAGALDVKVVTNTQLIQITAVGPVASQTADIANAVAQAFISQNETRSRGAMQASGSYLQQQLASVEQQVSDSQRRISELQAQPSNPQQQADIAAEQTKLSNFQGTYSTIARNLQDMQVADAAIGGTVDVVQPAVAPTAPMSRHVALTVVFAAVLGLLIAGVYVLAVEYLDDKVKTPTRVRQASGYGTLGMLYSSRGKEVDQQSAGAEAYRMLRTNLAFASLDKQWRSLLITSPGPGDGKTTVACNLAIVLAQNGKSVILVDLDLRSPTVHSMFAIANETGLSDLVLSDEITIDRYLTTTEFDNLRILPSGLPPHNPAEVIASERMGQVLALLLAEADIVIIDSPPVLAVTDPALLAARIDGTLIVVDARHTSSRHLRVSRDALQRVGARVLGVAINRLSGGDVAGRMYPYQAQSSNGRPPRQGASAVGVLGSADRG